MTTTTESIYNTNQAAAKSYLLHLADNGLILSHRLQEWCGHGPVLEEDIAMSNIGLDILGEARSYFQYLATLEGEGKTEDDYAFLRHEGQYRNLLLVEQEDEDFAYAIIKQFLYDEFHHLLLQALATSVDEELGAIARKSVKETAYHVKWSSGWVVRLGDGTEESNSRMQQALDALWPYTGEMFTPADYELELIDAGLIPDVRQLKKQWLQNVQEVLEEAALTLPPADTFMHLGGKNGVHTEKMGYILTDLQYMQRTYPGLKW